MVLTKRGGPTGITACICDNPRTGIVTLQYREREAPAAQELSGCCDRSPPRGHRRSAKGAVRLG